MPVLLYPFVRGGTGLFGPGRGQARIDAGGRYGETVVPGGRIAKNRVQGDVTGADKYFLRIGGKNPMTRRRMCCIDKNLAKTRPPKEPCMKKINYIFPSLAITKRVLLLITLSGLFLPHAVSAGSTTTHYGKAR